MMKLVSFESQESTEADDQDATEPRLLMWHVPRTVMPASLEASTRIIEQFLREPFDLDGEAANDMLRKKRKRPVRRRRSPSIDDDGLPRQPRPRKQAEVQQYKSAAFIDDSDDDEEQDLLFFAKEAERREKNRAAVGGASMMPHGKKKGKKTRKDTDAAAVESLNDSDDGGGLNDTSDDPSSVASPSRGRSPILPPSPSISGSADEEIVEPRARPAARKRRRRADPDAAEGSDDAVDPAISSSPSVPRPSARKRVVLGSDDEDSS
jgi:replication fork protection complex subunit Tof1/Swi1